MRATVTEQQVDAVQWLGTLDSLREVQALIFPGSPSVHRTDYDLPLQLRQLGVLIDKDQPHTKHALVFVRAGGWVVKDAQGRVDAMTNVEFVARYSVVLPTYEGNRREYVE